MVLIFAAVAPASAAAPSVKLTWSASANPAVAGFKVYYGPASRAYTNFTAVGNVTNTAITGLVDGATYFFAATTYDDAGHESTFSDEVSFTVPALPPPPVTNTPPPVVTNSSPVIPPAITNTLPVPPPVITNTPPPVLTNTVVTGPDFSGLPTLNPIANYTLHPGSALRSVILTGLSAGNVAGSQIVSVSATSSDPQLISNLTFQMGSSGTAGTLMFKTAMNSLGAATVTVTVQNDKAANNTFSRSFTVMLVAAAPVSNLRAPTFFRKPGNAISVIGKSVSLKAGATGTGVLKYAWKFNGQTILGATAPTLTLNKVSAAQAGIYSVTVSSQFGVTNSISALTVVESPAATLGAMTRLANGNFTFPVTGVPGYKYVVQATTDLTHWTSVATNTAPFVFEDTQTVDNEKRFFRAYYDSAL